MLSVDQPVERRAADTKQMSQMIGLMTLFPQRRSISSRSLAPTTTKPSPLPRSKQDSYQCLQHRLMRQTMIVSEVPKSVVLS